MTTYIKITFENIEPLKLTDGSTSQNGQANTLSYVSGTALRGAVIQALVKEEEFEKNKLEILSDGVAFLNAYPMADNRELIPSVKGFYEDKTDSIGKEKEIQNMLWTGEIEAGYKRASIGRYCYIDYAKQCIRYTKVNFGSDMKIRRKDKNIFRNQYLNPGYTFASYIAVTDNTELVETIRLTLESLKKDRGLILGGARSYGYGRCEIKEVKVLSQGTLPYEEYMPKEDQENEVYMMLLSNTAMINECGETVGMDFDILEKRLGVTLDKDKLLCSTSIQTVNGHNSTWRCNMPSVKMFEMGSVFKLIFSGKVLSKEVMYDLMNTGIGIRNNEGFGRILFLNEYEKVNKKLEIEKSKKKFDEKAGEKVKEKELSPEEKATLKVFARGYYQQLIKVGRSKYIANQAEIFRKLHLNSSQIGQIESILLANLYDGDKGFEKLMEYFIASEEKQDAGRIQKTETVNQKAGKSAVAQYVQKVGDVETDFAELLNIPNEVMGFQYTELFEPQEIVRMKQELLIMLIKWKNREGADYV